METEAWPDKLKKELVSFFAAIAGQKLKIALISYYYESPTISGVGIHTRFLAKFLAKNNCEVHVFCSSDKTKSYADGKVRVHGIGRANPNMNGNFQKKRLEYFLFEAEAVKALMRENARRKFAILHTQGSLTNAAFLAKKVCGTKWVHTFHAIEKSRIMKLSEEEKQFGDLISWIESNVNHCDGAIYVSNSLSKQGRRAYRIKSSVVIPNGVDTDLFPYAPIRRKNVLFIGRFSKEKGVELLPKIIEKVLTVKGTTFTALSPFNTLPADLNELNHKLLAYKGKHPSRVNLITNSASQDYVAKLYKDCQVYIQPSTYESFGLCVAEAMATGRPVVSFNVGGIPELVGDCGFVVRDKREFLAKIEELLKNRELCAAIGKKARARAENLDWESIAKKTLDYYIAVLKD